MGKKLFSLTGLLVAVAFFIALNAFASVALRRTTIDLTEHKLFSLSEGSRNIIRNLEEPLDLKFYYTPEQAPDGSGLAEYAQRVQELLETYAAESDGKLRLQVIDPKPFTEEEDQAAQGGLQGYPINSLGDKVYCGLIATNSVDETEVIPFFEASREASLEYDITQLIYRLGTEDRPVIGLMSSLPLSGGPPDPRTRQPPQRWAIYDFIAQTLEVREVPTTAETIDPEIDVLMIVHPKELSPKTQYAIDQFALRGGRIMAFVDPFCFFDPAGQGDPRGAMSADRSSHMETLLAAWGVEMDSKTIVGDVDKGQAIPDGQGGQTFAPVFMALDGESFDQTDLSLQDISGVSFLTAGGWQASEGATTQITPLVQTTANGSGTLDATAMQFGMMDFARLSEMFVPDNTPHATVIRLQGEIQSAFPDGPPGDPAAEPEDAEGASEESDADESAADEHLTSSAEPFHAVLFSDADLLADNLWVRRVGPFLSPQLGNGSLVVNLLENLTGSTDLINLRSREGYQRPFTKKAELEKAAGERLKQKAEEAEAAVEATNQRLTELQGPQETAGANLLSPEQAKEIEQLNKTLIQQRRELRDVRNQLNRDIKSLGTRMKLLNTVAVPVVLLVVLLVLAIVNSSKSRARRSQ